MCPPKRYSVPRNLEVNGKYQMRNHVLMNIITARGASTEEIYTGRSLSKMDNCSNCSTGLVSQEFLAFSSIILSLSILAIIFNVLTAIALCLDTGTIISLRMILVNLLVGDTATGIAVFMQNIESVILSVAKLNENGNIMPVDIVCRLFIWLHHVSLAVRLFSLAIYSVAVLLYIRRGKSGVTPPCSALVIAMTWVGALVLSADRLVPQITDYDHVDGVRCLPESGELAEVRISLLAVWVIFGGLAPSTVCITALIVSVCYLKRRTSLEGSTYKKALVRLSFFLFLANVFNILWIVLPPSLALLAENVATATVREVISYLISVISMLSLLTTPIIIVIFMRMVRLKLLTLLCWCKTGCHANKTTIRRDLRLQLLAN